MGGSFELTGITVGSRALYIASGSPAESTASRASSNTGSGGHQTISFSSLSLHLRRPSSSPPITTLLLIELLLGQKGTRNRKQDLRSSAFFRLIEAACSLLPRTESRSAAVDFAEDEEDLREKEGLEKKKWEEEDDEETATESEKTSAILRGIEGFLISLSLYFFSLGSLSSVDKLALGIAEVAEQISTLSASVTQDKSVRLFFSFSNMGVIQTFKVNGPLHSLMGIWKV